MVSEPRMQAGLAARRHRTELLERFVAFLLTMPDATLREKLPNILDTLNRIQDEQMKLDNNFDLLLGTKALLAPMDPFLSVQPVTVPRQLHE